jgi:hypothetical protein
MKAKNNEGNGKKEISMKAKEILFNMDCFFIEHFDRDAKFATFAKDFAEAMRIGNGSDDPILDVVNPLLSLGFIVGQLFEVTDPDIVKEIEFMKHLIRKKGLLAMLPRERKAA